MTWTEFCVKFIFDNGVFEEDAKTIVAYAKEHKLFAETMASRWNDKVADYPVVMKGIITTSIKAVAHEWIEANQPQAWYKAMFA